MINIRHGVFETNSSSVHSLTMCTADAFDQWVRGEVMFDTYNDRLVNVKPAITEQDKKNAMEYYDESKSRYWREWDQLSEEEMSEWYMKYMNDYGKFDSDRYKTYEKFFNDGCFETYHQSYTTPNGEKIVAFGYYGHD